MYLFYSAETKPPILEFIFRVQTDYLLIILTSCLSVSIFVCVIYTSLLPRFSVRCQSYKQNDKRNSKVKCLMIFLVNTQVVDNEHSFHDCFTVVSVLQFSMLYFWQLMVILGYFPRVKLHTCSLALQGKQRGIARSLSFIYYTIIIVSCISIRYALSYN